ncbi:MAG: dTDP-4-dehydrorhamnose reductase [bacterium]|nr:dTDP-4-dehydrorhamnose reductase [bacterium]
MSKILIIGAKGKLGGRIFANLSAMPHHTVSGIDVDEIDIADFYATRAMITQFAPQVVINCAAWTDVDGCAKDPQKALRINGYGAGNIAIASTEIGAEVVQISSNEVFDGISPTPYNEHDITHPINPYAYSKWVGEREVMNANPRHYIVRTAWLFAHGGKNFIQSILNAVSAGKQLRVVTDEVANPTYNDDLADAVIKLIETHRYGIFHMVNTGSASRYQFARYILDRAGFTDTPITPILSKEWSRPSTPPTYASLNNNHGTFLGITLRHWHEAIDDFLMKEGLFNA